MESAKTEGLRPRPPPRARKSDLLDENTAQGERIRRAVGTLSRRRRTPHFAPAGASLKRLYCCGLPAAGNCKQLRGSPKHRKVTKGYCGGSESLRENPAAAPLNTAKTVLLSGPKVAVTDYTVFAVTDYTAHAVIDYTVFGEKWSRKPYVL